MLPVNMLHFEAEISNSCFGFRFLRELRGGYIMANLFSKTVPHKCSSAIT